MSVATLHNRVVVTIDGLYFSDHATTTDARVSAEDLCKAESRGRVLLLVNGGQDYYETIRAM